MAKRTSGAILFLILFFEFTLNSFSAQVVIIGKTLEEGTNRPIGLDFQLVTKSGKKVKCRSNSKDGSFQQILEPAETYYVSFNDYILSYGNSAITTPDAKTYVEINHDFVVKKVVTGLELFNVKMFAPNQSELFNGNTYILEELKAFMDLNIKAEIVITISSADSWFEPITKKEKIKDKKNKTKTIMTTITSEEQLDKLLDDRIASLKKYFENTKAYEKRISYSKDLVVNKPAKSKKVQKSKNKNKNQDSPSLVIPNIVNTKIVVGRIKNL